ncbi:MAG: hypothetical protein AAF515_10910 [Pseudomonadota bacterium]
MARIETDYLVVGAGAIGMAFVDVLLERTDADIVIVDKRCQPGGHWVDGYPFLRLHQPSAFYGVPSCPLGMDRVDTDGVNAGFYERAGVAEINDYYQKVMQDRFLASDRVRFLPSTEYLAVDQGEHSLRGTLSGTEIRVKARRKLVDATYLQSSIPATHDPKQNRVGFTCDPDVRMVTPGELVNCFDCPDGFTLIGAGKTAMDTCCWLIDAGVDPNRIRWIRPRDGWLVNRVTTQPLDLSANMLIFQGHMMAAAATSGDGYELACRMEEQELYLRIDTQQRAPIYRGATIALSELEALRTVENVVRKGYIQSVDTRRVRLTEGELKHTTDHVFIDCTAPGLANKPLVPIFRDDKIIIQYTTVGVAPWTAAVVGFFESLDISTEDKNACCAPLPRTGLIEDQPVNMHRGFALEGPRRKYSEYADWSSACRLNAGRSIAEHMADPEVGDAVALMSKHGAAAMKNLARMAAARDNNLGSES